MINDTALVCDLTVAQLREILTPTPADPRPREVRGNVALRAALAAHQA